MGCPPDPIEVSLGRGNEDSIALKQKADDLIPQTKSAAQFFVGLCLSYNSIILIELQRKAEALNKDALNFDSSDLGKTFGWNDFPESYGDYPNMSVMYSHLSNSESYVKRIEINLCITRDLLLKAVRMIGEKNLSASELKNYLEEKNLHLIHRREDKEIKIKALENDISTCQFLISTKEHNYTEEERQQYTEKLKRLEPELKRIAALTDDELLQNRELF
jgi:hypothetical protein